MLDLTFPSVINAARTGPTQHHKSYLGPLDGLTLAPIAGRRVDGEFQSHGRGQGSARWVRVRMRMRMRVRMPNNLPDEGACSGGAC